MYKTILGYFRRTMLLLNTALSFKIYKFQSFMQNVQIYMQNQFNWNLWRVWIHNNKYLFAYLHVGLCKTLWSVFSSHRHTPHKYLVTIEFDPWTLVLEIGVVMLLKVGVSEEILKWHSHSLSLIAELWFFFLQLASLSRLSQ